MVLKRKDVTHIADLCNLDLSLQESKELSLILTETIGYIGVLSDLDTKNVPETYQVSSLENVFKNDGASSTLTQEEALLNASERVGDKFGTEAVFDRK